MEGVELTCPHCSYAGRAKIAPPAGAKIRCPRCRGEWTQPTAALAIEPALFEVIAPTVAAETPKRSRSKLQPGWRKPQTGETSSFEVIWWVVGTIVIIAALLALVSREPMAFFMVLFMLGLATVPLSFMGFLGAYIADQKNRPEHEGFLFGFFLGPLGWIIEAVLPSLPAPAESTGE